MAHGLWMRCDEEWGVLPMTESEVSLAAAAASRPAAADMRIEGGPAMLVKTRLGDNDAWILLAGPAPVWVNGRRVYAGVRVLDDWDELRINNERIYYSTEELPRVEPFVAGEMPTNCARCKQEINHGDPSVRCPACGVVYHQIESDLKDESDLNCFTYRGACQCCKGPTQLDAGYVRTPEDI